MRVPSSKVLSMIERGTLAVVAPAGTTMAAGEGTVPGELLTNSTVSGAEGAGLSLRVAVAVPARPAATEFLLDRAESVAQGGWVRMGLEETLVWVASASRMELPETTG